MRRSLILIAAASLALVSTAGSAADVEETLQRMQQRMNALEARLDATTDELEAANERVEQQQELITSSGLAEPRGSDSSLGSFAETVEIGGWVAASWFWNFNNPDGSCLNGLGTTGTCSSSGGGGGNVGNTFGNGSGGSYPFHPDSNSFSLDQLWFEIERPVSEENRAGFRADIVYGKTGGLLSGDFGAGDGFSGNDLTVYQGYAQYLAPIGPGIHFKAGKFATVIGAEVAQSPYNFNITRGQIYQLFQPFTHTGIMGSVEGEMGTSFTLGLVNETRSFPGADIDVNNNKAMIWNLAWSGDTMGASFAGAFGDTPSGSNQGTTRSGDKEQIYDLIVSFDPSENFSGYINADYRITEAGGATTGVGDADEEGWGIAAAGRYAINERLGLALRGEYLDIDFENVDTVDGDDNNLRYWGLTTTADYALTEALTVRGEVRYDNYAQSNDTDALFSKPFIDGNDISENDQFVAGLEVIYNF